MNNHAQHGRSYNVRIFGIQETEGEKVKGKVCQLVEKALGIPLKEADIAAAHRLPTKHKDKPKPVIVKFVDKEKKFQILKVRKKLKGTGQSISEDMTSQNMKLMNRAANSNQFKSVWFSNGKVHGTDMRGKHRILELFEPFQSHT